MLSFSYRHFVGKCGSSHRQNLVLFVEIRVNLVLFIEQIVDQTLSSYKNLVEQTLTTLQRISKVSISSFVGKNLLFENCVENTGSFLWSRFCILFSKFRRTYGAEVLFTQFCGLNLALIIGNCGRNTGSFLRSRFSILSSIFCKPNGSLFLENCLERMGSSSKENG